MRFAVRQSSVTDPIFAEAVSRFTPAPRRALGSVLERDVESAGGMVRIRRIVEPDGHFRPVDGYRSADGMLSICREPGETYAEFEKRVLEAAEWRALHDGHPLHLFPVTE